MNDAAYEAALAEVTEATHVYDAVVAAYRARKIDDAAFLAARAVYNAADAKFEAFMAARVAARGH